MWVALEPFLTPILGIALALGIIGLMFGSDKGRKAFAQGLSNWVGGAVDVVVPILNGVEGGLAPIARAFVQSFRTTGPGLLDIFKDPASELALKSWLATELALLET